MARRGDNIRKRKDGRWEGRYKKKRNSEGAIIYGSVYGKTYLEVKEKLSKVPLETSQHVKYNKSYITFGDVLIKWIDNNKVRLKGATINKYRNIIETQIMPDLGNTRMIDITATKINEFISQKQINGRINGSGGLSSSYIRSIVLVINAAIKYAVAEDLCNPLKTSICKPSPEKKELLILTIEEQRKLESTLLFDFDERNVGILISLYTGLRIGELCALSWDDIDLKRKIIHVRHTIARIKDDNPNTTTKTKLIVDTPKTQSSFRDVPISTQLFPILERLKENSVSYYVISRTPSTFLCPRTFEYHYHRMLEYGNIRSVNFHCIRHTFATRCIEAGVDVKSLSEILGHANVSITLNTYVHSSMDLKRMQMEKLNNHIQYDKNGQKNGTNP